MADYSLDQTILTVLVSGTSATGSYTAGVYEGGCKKSDVAAPLSPIGGRTGLSITAVPLGFDELVQGNYFLGIASLTAERGGTSCTRLIGQ